jgi:hypothetical protein
MNGRVYSTEDIICFIREQTAHRGSITEDTALEEDLGVYGDDMHELIEEYSSRFSFDVTNYLWYFHTGDEGFTFISIGAFFSAPPYQRVEHIPITVGMLHDFANQGRWNIPYPEHLLPEGRLDLIIDRYLYLFLFALVSGFVIYKECR